MLGPSGGRGWRTRGNTRGTRVPNTTAQALKIGSYKSKDPKSLVVFILISSVDPVHYDPVQYNEVNDL